VLFRSGTQNPINLVKATMDGLTGLRTPQDVAKLRGLSIKQVLGLDLQEAAKKAEAPADGEAPTPEAVVEATPPVETPAEVTEAPSE